MIASTQKINLAWKGVRDEQRAVQRQFEINNRTLVATQRVFHSVNSVLRTAVGIYQTYTLMQIRSQDATKNLRDANNDLNDTLAEFGPNSKEYLKALQDQKDAADELAKTNTDNLVGSILLISTAIGTVFTAATSAIPRVKQLLSIGSKVGGSVASKAAVPTPTPKSTGIGAKLGGRLGGVAGGVLSGVASAGLYLAQLMGEQNASAPSSGGSQDVVPDNGIDAWKNVGRDIYVTITNMINSPTPDQMVKDITNGTQKGLAFKAN